MNNNSSRESRCHVERSETSLVYFHWRAYRSKIDPRFFAEPVLSEAAGLRMTS
jgi:hypothetical protein